jgi:hypothetical protein
MEKWQCSILGGEVGDMFAVAKYLAQLRVVSYNADWILICSNSEKMGGKILVYRNLLLFKDSLIKFLKNKTNPKVTHLRTKS